MLHILNASCTKNNNLKGTRTNNNRNNNNNATRSLCSENQNARLAHVRGEASARTGCIQLDAVWTRHEPKHENHVSTGVQAVSRDHADPPHCGHGKHGKHGKHASPTPHGCSDRHPGHFQHRIAVGTERTGDVPTEIGHRAFVGQFTASRHEHVDPVAASVQTSATSTTSTAFHADPIQNIELNLALTVLH